MTLEELWEAIKDRGPQRVVINQEGEAVAPFRARDIDIRIIFIRDDGWSLAASIELESIAHALWRDKWTGFSLHPFTAVQPMANYRAGISKPERPPCMSLWRGPSGDVAKMDPQKRGEG